MNSQVYNRITDLNKKENRKVYISDKVTKLIEEVGEFSAVHLEDIGYKYVKEKRSEEEKRKHALEELCDMHIMVLDIFAHYGFTEDEIIKMTNKKIDKWENYIK